MSFFATAINFLALPFATASYRNDLRRTLLALSAVGALVLFVLVGAMLATVLPNLPAFDVVTDYRPKIPLRIYTADGALLGEFGDEHRDFTPIKEIPPVLKDALLAIEDARFYEHSGVDYRGVLLLTSPCSIIMATPPSARLYWGRHGASGPGFSTYPLA